MLVKHVLDRKPQGVTTVTSEKTLLDAAAVLSARKIGALIVSENGESIDGIISERDIVRGISAYGPSCLSRELKEFMTANVQCCTPADTIFSVHERMSSGNFRHMPVAEDDRLVAMLSIRDLMAARTQMVEAENDALTGMIVGY